MHLRHAHHQAGQYTTLPDATGWEQRGDGLTHSNDLAGGPQVPRRRSAPKQQRNLHHLARRPRKVSRDSARTRELPEPLDITGRIVTNLKIATSFGVFPIVGTFVAIVYIGNSHFRQPLPSFLILVGMLMIGLTTIRAATSAFSKKVFRMADVPNRPFEGAIAVSGETLRKWEPGLALMLLVWVAGYLGPVLIASAVIVSYGCLAWVWALRPMVTAIEPRKASQAEYDAWHRLGARVRREANALLSQWLSGLSTALALALILFAGAAVGAPPRPAPPRPAPPRLHIWRWALIFAVAYIIVGSLLRAAAETSNPLWIDIDVARLWKVTKRTLLLAATVAGVGAAIGALVAFFIWLSGHLGTGGQTLDMGGRWVTAGTALGAVAGILTVPRLAFARRKELHRENHDRQAEAPR